MSTERFPAFFDQVPRLTVRDPLADFLGAAEGGVLEYGYADAVRLAGHSCPTVAGAWLMTRAALARLHPGAVPRRGGIRVELRQPLAEVGLQAFQHQRHRGRAKSKRIAEIAGQVELDRAQRRFVAPAIADVGQ